MTLDSMLAHCLRFAQLGDANYARKAAKWYAGMLPWLLSDLPARLDVEIARLSESSCPSEPSPASTPASTGRRGAGA